MTLANTLHQIDGSGYGAYKRISGTHRLTNDIELSVDRVQSDPFAPPSLIQVRVPLESTGIVPETLAGVGSVAAGDHLTRRVVRAIGEHAPHGGKTAGKLSIDTPGQQVLERTSVVFTNGPSPKVVVRMEAALPAQGRRIRGRAAATLLTKALPKVINQALLNISHRDLDDAVTLFADQIALREMLVEHDLVGFIADGAILPRAAGNSDVPAHQAVPFESPASLQRSFTLPSGRELTGMALPRGVSLIVGGGYHGKSTLLRALEHGVYNHIGGDGREFAVTVDDAVALRAEDGRSVANVDIATFIRDLPAGTDTTRFSTTNASGSTSQAAGLMEALEAGATTLLIDEDTSATNFMIRDERMRKLVPREKEPITPLLDRIRTLWQDQGVSTVLVAGGSGAFLDVVDRVVLLDHYRVFDITSRAQQLAEPIEEQEPFPTPKHRIPKRLAPLKNQRGSNKGWQAKGLRSIRHSNTTIDLTALHQLVDPAQTNSIAAILRALENEVNGARSLTDLITQLFDKIQHDGLETISPFRGHPGRLAKPRPQEVFATINRNRSVAMLDPGPSTPEMPETESHPDQQ